ncbi:MAG TPA: hypothetical protein VGD22_19690 [Sphingobacteriaceae bacterium]
MKLILIVISLVTLIGCGPESSPEGRMRKKLDAVQKELDSLGNTRSVQSQIDSLKAQNKALSDSIAKINQEIQKLKPKH